jgi:predicted nucleic acid-binding protein
LIADTDVLVWAMRGYDAAMSALEKIETLRISVVTYMEMLQGMKNQRESQSFERGLRSLSAEIIHINERISNQAAILMSRYALSHHLQLADALIASTAIAEGETLLTGNVKHYKHLPGLEIARFAAP